LGCQARLQLAEDGGEAFDGGHGALMFGGRQDKGLG
jgi:hypothetical protein